MTTEPRNPLAESGKPLFVRVETANRADSPPPVPRLGGCAAGTRSVVVGHAERGARRLGSAALRVHVRVEGYGDASEVPVVAVSWAALCGPPLAAVRRWAGPCGRRGYG